MLSCENRSQNFLKSTLCQKSSKQDTSLSEHYTDEGLENWVDFELDTINTSLRVAVPSRIPSI